MGSGRFAVPRPKIVETKRFKKMLQNEYLFPKIGAVIAENGPNFAVVQAAPAGGERRRPDPSAGPSHCQF